MLQLSHRKKYTFPDQSYTSKFTSNIPFVAMNIFFLFILCLAILNVSVIISYQYW